MLGVLALMFLGGIGGWFGKMKYQVKLDLFQSILVGGVCGSAAGVLGANFFRNGSGSIEFIIIIGTISFIGGYLSIFIGKYFWKKPYLFNLKDNNPKKNTIDKSQFDDFKLDKIFETETTYEIIGTEHRMIDNSNNNGHVKRRMIISREWKKTFTFSENVNASNEKSGRLSFQLVELGLKLSNAIENKYDFQNMETKIYSEEIELDILPQSKVILEIDWKIIWQNGLIELIDSENNIVFYPYRVAKGLTFDQTQRKTN